MSAFIRRECSIFLPTYSRLISFKAIIAPLPHELIDATPRCCIEIPAYNRGDFELFDFLIIIFELSQSICHRLNLGKLDVPSVVIEVEMSICHQIHLIVLIFGLKYKYQTTVRLLVKSTAEIAHFLITLLNGFISISHREAFDQFEPACIEVSPGAIQPIGVEFLEKVPFIAFAPHEGMHL
jgi:hypothetical protein